MDTLRRLAPLAPVPGAVLASVVYGLDPSFGSGGYPAHRWSTYGVVAGWWLVQVGLTFLAPNLVTRWLAFLGGAFLLLGASYSGSSALLPYAAGFLLTAVLLLVASATYVVHRFRLRGRISAAIALTAIGVGGLLSFGYPDSPFLNNPATQVLAALLLSPLFIASGAVWLALDKPLGAVTPASFGRRFVAGIISWVIFGVLTSTLLAAAGQAVPQLTNPDASVWVNYFSYLLGVVVLQIVPTALWGRTLGQLAMRLRVVRADDGSPPGWLRSIVRLVVFQSVPVLGLIYLLAWAVLIRLGIGRGAPDRLAWDRASGTAVIRIDAPAPSSPRSEPAPVPAPEETPEPTARDATWQSYE